MGNRIGRLILSLILTAGVLLGAYLGFMRYLSEVHSRTLELVVDLNDVKKMAAFEKKPLSPILDEIKNIGIAGVGVFEETLADANAIGELYYAKGSGIQRFKQLSPVLNSFCELGRIRPDRTYIYVPEKRVRKRVYNQLRAALGEKAIKFLNQEVLEIDEAEEELQSLGIGMSESQTSFLAHKGFQIIPRVWNDPRYHLGNMEAKISALSSYELIIFDGDEILGYPDALPMLAEALKKFKIKYGYVEIVKQEGDSALKQLMDRQVVRVHSVPKDELKKIKKEEALDRFVRAARERSVRLVYLRPFLPPQIDAYPVEYNLAYFKELKARLESAGFILGKSGGQSALQVKDWQVLLLAIGVLICGLFLLERFFGFSLGLIYLLLIFGATSIWLLEALGYVALIQKLSAFSTAVIFPTSAVISTFSRPLRGKILPIWDSTLLIINILAESGIGIFLMIGLLADYKYMSGIQTFPAVKAALILPVIIVAGYFLLKSGEGSLYDRVQNLLKTKVSLAIVFLGLFAAGALAVLVARSGNFVLPVPGFEKIFRNWLEMILFVRPRTKEFLVGYPFLFLAAAYYLRGKKSWLWLLTAVGVIAPVSVFNSFSHIHTPIVVSLVRTFNGMVLGLLMGWLAWVIVNKYVGNTPE